MEVREGGRMFESDIPKQGRRREGSLRGLRETQPPAGLAMSHLFHRKEHDALITTDGFTEPRP